MPVCIGDGLYFFRVAHIDCCVGAEFCHGKAYNAFFAGAARNRMITGDLILVICFQLDQIQLSIQQIHIFRRHGQIIFRLIQHSVQPQGDPVCKCSRCGFQFQFFHSTFQQFLFWNRLRDESGTHRQLSADDYRLAVIFQCQLFVFQRVRRTGIGWTGIRPTCIGMAGIG